MTYRITADTHSWAIEQKYVAGAEAKEPGKVTWKQVAWYPTLKLAALGLLERAGRDEAPDVADDAQKILAAVEKATAHVLSALNEVSA